MAERCPDCGTELSPGALVCPSCHRLTHGARLKQLAEDATQAQARNDVSAALGLWRQALPLLPPESGQHAQISARVVELSRGLSSQSSAPGRGRRWGWAGLGTAALAFLGKAKLLLLGLTKLTTLSTMFLAFGVYWSLWGWRFAAGVVLCTYVHEMGHVLALRRYGIPASAPMFIPGFGALVRLNQAPATTHEDARVGLAGPIFGLAATALVLVAAMVTGWPSLLAIAKANGLINLFNLIPVGQLDGGRAFRSLSGVQMLLVLSVLGGLWLISHETMLFLVGAAAVYRVWTARGSTESDWSMSFQYSLVAACLTAISSIPVPHR